MKDAAMQMLEMSKEQRQLLADKNAFAVNGKGQEVLQGLTAEESQFLVDHGGAAAHAMAGADLERYGRLLVKHEQARLRIASVENEVVKGDDGLG